MKVAVLFARADSVYKTFPICDVYDIDRDARTYGGGLPIVAHPPCRAWGGFAMFAKPRVDEKALAPWAINQIRQFGGVLEHPMRSKLWPEMNLPAPGERDAFGGWTLPIFQHWWGHRAEKATRLYVVGCDPKDIPEIPLRLDKPQFVIGDARDEHGNYRPEISKPEREKTPIALAEWLVELAQRCGKVQRIAA